MKKNMIFENYLLNEKVRRIEKVMSYYFSEKIRVEIDGQKISLKAQGAQQVGIELIFYPENNSIYSNRHSLECVNAFINAIQEEFYTEGEQ
jgi:hypothetical protein